MMLGGRGNTRASVPLSGQCQLQGRPGDALCGGALAGPDRNGGAFTQTGPVSQLHARILAGVELSPVPGPPAHAMVPVSVHQACLPGGSQNRLSPPQLHILTLVLGKPVGMLCSGFFFTAIHARACSLLQQQSQAEYTELHWLSLLQVPAMCLLPGCTAQGVQLVPAGRQ